MTKFEWFICGFLVGWLFIPVYKLLTIIIKEAKLARSEWHNPQSTSNRSGPDEHAP
jgi:hypothetical protein